jgi:hypothetical protein
MADSQVEQIGGEDHGSADFRLSAVLAELAAGPDDERISIGDLLAALKRRALGALIFIFAAPVALPLPPGASTIFAAPLIFLTAQLMLGMRPWLPRVITDRSLSRKEFRRIIDAAIPWLKRAESVMRPRLSFMGQRPAIYLVGLVCLLLAVILILPIPLGNMLPALATAIMALGLLARDGLWILIGLAIAVVSVVIVWGVAWGVLFGALYVIGNVFGLKF